MKILSNCTMLTKKKVALLVFDLALIGWGSWDLYQFLSLGLSINGSSFWEGSTKYGVVAISVGIIGLISTFKPSFFKKLKQIYKKNNLQT